MCKVTPPPSHWMKPYSVLHFTTRAAETTSPAHNKPILLCQSSTEPVAIGACIFRLSTMHVASSLSASN